jgi:predicted dinucleotide-binding enzyme
MKIAVIGAGRVGSTLGRKWGQTGHEVVFGVREPAAAKIVELLPYTPGASAMTTGDALAGAEVVVLALPGTAVEEFVRQHKGALNGRLIIDATNQIGRPVMHNMAFFATETPQAQVYRAFNSVGVEVLAEPQFATLTADHFFCGPSGIGRDVVERLILDIGLQPRYLGGPEAASLLDGLTRLWFALVFDGGYSRHTALKLLAD